MFKFFKRGLSSSYITKNIKWEIFNHLYRLLVFQRLELWSLLHRNRKHQWTCFIRGRLLQLKKSNSTWLPVLIKVNQNTVIEEIHPNTTHPTFVHTNKFIILFLFLKKHNLWTSLHAHLHTASASLDWLLEACLNTVSMSLLHMPWRNMAKYWISASHCYHPSCTFFFLFLYHKYRNRPFPSTSSSLLLELCP